MREHKPASHKRFCNNCKVQFDQPSLQKGHGNSRANYTCKLCAKTITTQSEVGRHNCREPPYKPSLPYSPGIHIHSRHMCDKCKEPPDQSSLPETHMGSSCGNCGISSYQPSPLGAHISSRCKLCSEDFTLVPNLKRHRNGTHTESEPIINPKNRMEDKNLERTPPSFEFEQAPNKAGPLLYNLIPNTYGMLVCNFNVA